MVKKLLLTLLFLACFPFHCSAKDIITLNLCNRINTRVPNDFNVVTTLNGKQEYYLWAHIKFEPIGIPEANTYYLEWRYNDGKSEIVLDNYNKNNKLKYTRSIHYNDDYWWVIKAIYSSNPGEYTFRIYTKEGGRLVNVTEKQVIVEE